MPSKNWDKQVPVQNWFWCRFVQFNKASRLSYALQWILSILSNLSNPMVGPLHCKQDKVTSYHKFLLWSVEPYPSDHHSPAVYHRLDFPKNHHDRQPLGTINVWWFQVSTRLRSNHSWNGSIIRFQLCRIGIVRSMLNSMQITIAPLRKFHWRQDKLLRTWILEEHLPQKFTSKGTLQTNPGTQNVPIYSSVKETQPCSQMAMLSNLTSTSTIIC